METHRQARCTKQHHWLFRRQSCYRHRSYDMVADWGPTWVG